MMDTRVVMEECVSSKQAVASQVTVRVCKVDNVCLRAVELASIFYVGYLLKRAYKNKSSHAQSAFS